MSTDNKPMFERDPLANGVPYIFESSAWGEAQGHWIVVKATRRAIELSRNAGGVYVSLQLDPDQARAIATELVAAADAIEAAQ